MEITFISYFLFFYLTFSQTKPGDKEHTSSSHRNCRAGDDKQSLMWKEFAICDKRYGISAGLEVEK